MDNDFAVCVDQETLNTSLRALHGRDDLKKFREGRQQVTIGGNNEWVDWKIDEPPHLRLQPPSDALWRDAIKENAQAPKPTTNAFVLTFPKFWFKRDGQEGKTTSIEAICTLTAQDGKCTFTPHGAKVDLTGFAQSDRVIYRQIIVPRLLREAGKLLAGLSVPNINVYGLSFGPIAAAVGDDRVITVANLRDRPNATPPSTTALPKRGNYVLLSKNTMEKGAKLAAVLLNGYAWQGGGGDSYWGGWYKCTAGFKVNSINAHANSPTGFSVYPDLGGWVSVDGRHWFVRYHLGYSFVSHPNPVEAVVDLSVVNNSVSLKLKDLKDFWVEAVSDGHWLSWICKPLVQALVNNCVPKAREYLIGKSVQVFTVPDIPLNIAEVNVKLTLRNLTLDEYDGMARLTATPSLS
ncbi:hypothetical protein F1721_18175 [Saccharopolyspora hirsuta]|uniref:Uncharacterized protein n=1 Tax=Saccharopolyspora hirsuta TaxID=1837 RepID=A0A5M7BRL0_SACHI|nr:hypothetical protein [Saccharopolyspora hirsuta]KAA5831770.1 hypothetical protein F1721_18175 [Saccharopolyspora hirsuta]